jgi:hypothetical protein
MLRSKIIDYYDDLKNRIDIQCEQVLASHYASETLKAKCDALRQTFIAQITKVFEFNVRNFKKTCSDCEIDNQPDVGAILFREKFCFWIANYDGELSESKPLGILVITNQFINKTIRGYLDNFIAKLSTYYVTCDDYEFQLIMNAKVN